jgi:transcriptional regulator with XRE-family HTH domain
VVDWRGLRKALALTQLEMAELLGLSEAGLQKLERPPHHCPRKSTLMMLRVWLQEPEYVARLRRACFDHPFPEDLEPNLETTHLETNHETRA